MTSTFSRLIALGLGVLALGGTARAGFFTGDPTDELRVELQRPDRLEVLVRPGCLVG